MIPDLVVNFNGGGTANGGQIGRALLRGFGLTGRCTQSCPRSATSIRRLQAT